jgi:hypothetical protein
MANQVEDTKFDHKFVNVYPTKCMNASYNDQQPNVLPTLQKWV